MHGRQHASAPGAANVRASGCDVENAFSHRADRLLPMFAGGKCPRQGLRCGKCASVQRLQKANWARGCSLERARSCGLVVATNATMRAYFVKHEVKWSTDRFRIGANAPFISRPKACVVDLNGEVGCLPDYLHDLLAGVRALETRR